MRISRDREMLIARIRRIRVGRIEAVSAAREIATPLEELVRDVPEATVKELADALIARSSASTSRVEVALGLAGVLPKNGRSLSWSSAGDAVPLPSRSTSCTITRFVR